MPPTLYKDLELSRAEKKLLKSLFRNKKIPLSIKGKPKYNFLFKYCLIDYADNSHKYYHLSDKGKFYLRYNRKDKFRFWFPSAISIIAVVISVIALVISIQ